MLRWAQDPGAHVARPLELADALSERGIPVVTIALVDDNRDLWREVAERTGGIYLVMTRPRTGSTGVWLADGAGMM